MICGSNRLGSLVARRLLIPSSPERKLIALPELSSDTKAQGLRKLLIPLGLVGRQK